MTAPDYPKRLSLLRKEIAAAGYDGLIVPGGDEYQSAYVGPSARRLDFLTGFTGSAGTLVVLKDKALLFVDGRYTLQAARQIPARLFTLFDVADKSPLAWLEENAKEGMKIAYDPWLHTASSAEALKKALGKKGAFAVPAQQNPVDLVWAGRPPSPVTAACAHDLAFAGKSAAEKRREIAAVLKEKNCAAALIADVASIAWLLNVRGHDELYAPVVFSRALIRDDGAVHWFVDPEKKANALSAPLGPDVSIHPPSELPAALERLAKEGKNILVDPDTTPSRILDYLSAAGAKIEKGEDPCALPRAVKNKTEQTGMRKAHVYDGVALTAFLAWLESHWETGALTEVEAQEKLEAFRKAHPSYRGPSFETISATGGNGALIHYTASAQSNAALKRGDLFLVDSGGQYGEGTTDVTRTVILGEPSAAMRENFTRVLKGHIALAMARFPEGTAGHELDVLARQYLWAVGRDYNHGTGHGVGSYLSVHEGPQAISKRGHAPLQAGMVVSNEPGYYQEGAYGIRIENLQMVVEIPGMALGKRKMLGFETLTLAPIDQRLIDASLMIDAEILWLNAYHQRVRETLQSFLDEATLKWLARATAPMEKQP